MTNGKSHLRLVIVHDAGNNEYCVSAHNITPEEADALIQEWNQHLVEGCRMLDIAQPKPHRAPTAQECRACRDTVARSSGFDHKPKFKRRKP
jgi:hypothetical protein